MERGCKWGGRHPRRLDAAGPVPHHTAMTVLLAALSAFMYGSADFAAGYATRRNPVFSVLVVSQVMGTVVALATMPFLEPASPRTADLLWGAAAGLCGAVGLVALYRGIAETPVAVVSPVSALAGALVPMTFGLIIGERPSSLAWAGAALCLPAAVLLSVERGRPGEAPAVRRALLLGLAAGAGFGGFFVSMSRTPAGSGLWPLIAARATSVAAVLLVSAFARRRFTVAVRDLGWVLVGGLLDMGANIAFLLAARSGMLVLVSVITATFPAPTVLLARLFMHQRLGPARAAGLAMAIAGVALIGAG